MRFVYFPAFVKELVQLVACFRECGSRVDHAFEDPFGRSEVIVRPQGEAEVELNFQRAGGKPRGFIQTFHRLSRFAVAQEGIAQIHAVPGGLRGNFHSEPKLLDGLRRAFAAQQRNAEEVQRIGVARREAQRQPEMPLGIGISARLEPLGAGFELGECFARRVCQNFRAR